MNLRNRTIIYLLQLCLLLLCIILILGFCGNFRPLWTAMVESESPLRLICPPLLMLVFVVIIYVITFCNKVKIKDRTFVIGSLILYAIIQCSLIFSSSAIDTYHGDFMVMNNVTSDVARKSFLGFFETLNNAPSVAALLLRRGFPYLYPLYHFGFTELIYTQFLNMLLIALIGLCVFDIAKLLVNSTAAKCALLFFLCAPIQAIYQLTPNYDVSGLFYIAVFQWGLIHFLVKYPFFKIKSLAYASVFATISSL